MGVCVGGRGSLRVRVYIMQPLTCRPCRGPPPCRTPPPCRPAPSPACSHIGRTRTRHTRPPPDPRVATPALHTHTIHTFSQLTPQGQVFPWRLAPVLVCVTLTLLPGILGALPVQQQHDFIMLHIDSLPILVVIGRSWPPVRP